MALADGRVSDAFSARMFEIAPEKCVFTSHVPSAASEREVDHASRIPCLKVVVLVYTVSRLAIDRFLIL